MMAYLMNHKPIQKTTLAVRSDCAVAIASKRHGANVAALGLNIEFIARRNPLLAVDLLRLWKWASALRADDAQVHDEDYALAEEMLQSLDASEQV